MAPASSLSRTGRPLTKRYWLRAVAAIEGRQAGEARQRAWLSRSASIGERIGAKLVAQDAPEAARAHGRSPGDKVEPQTCVAVVHGES